MFYCLRGSLSINALHACIIYIRQLSRSSRAPTLWFIELTVATCYIQYTFLNLFPFLSRENEQNTKILAIFVRYQNGRRRKHKRAKH